MLREHVADWFELDDDSPYMLLVADVVPSRRRLMNEDEEALFGIDKLNVARSEIPAVTHVDYSARIQTVHADTNPRYHDLLSAFHRRTGCPVLVNTSFNVRGEPIVCTPEDAFRCFGHRDRAPGRRQLRAPEAAAEPGAQAGLQGSVRARLTRQDCAGSSAAARSGRCRRYHICRCAARPTRSCAARG